MIEDDQIESFLRRESLLEGEELERALELADEQNRPLFDVVIDAGFVDEARLVDFASEALNVDRVYLDGVEPDDAVLETLPRSEAVAHWVLPLWREETDGNERLVLAMRDPIDMAAMEAVAEAVDIDVRPVLAGPKELESAIADAYDTEPSSLERGPFDYTAESSSSPGENPNDTKFGPGAASTFHGAEEIAGGTDDSDSGVHAAETAEGELDTLARQVEEDRDDGVEADDSAEREDAGSTNRLDSLRQRLRDGDEPEDREAMTTSRLIGQIAYTNGGLSEEAVDALKGHDVETILTAGLLALIERGDLTVDDLLEALPEE